MLREQKGEEEIQCFASEPYLVLWHSLFVGKLIPLEFSLLICEQGHQGECFLSFTVANFQDERMPFTWLNSAAPSCQILQVDVFFQDIIATKTLQKQQSRFLYYFLVLWVCSPWDLSFQYEGTRDQQSYEVWLWAALVNVQWPRGWKS